MKTNLKYVLFTCLLSTCVFSQNLERIEIKGLIVVDRNDVEGVTVFNNSSGKGTVTDKEGKFTIEVALNDYINISALQFKDFEVKISQSIINNKEITVYLIEEVNKLDQVVILPHYLTGNLDFDTVNIELIRPNLDALYFGLGNLDKLEIMDDYLTGINNIAMNENKFVNGINFVNIFDKLLNPIFKSKENKNDIIEFGRRSIMDAYSKKYLIEILNLKNEDILEFVYYVENKNFYISVLEQNNERDFLAYMKQQEQLFISEKYGKN